MTQSSFALVFPGDPETITGGFIYDREIRKHLTARGGDVRTVVLEGPFPTLDASIAERAVERMSGIKRGMPVVIDGLALGGFGDAVAPLSATHPLIALVHHPLALETGLTGEESKHYAQAERAALSLCSGVITTSETTGETLIADFEVPRESCVVVPPGVVPFEEPRPKAEPGGPVRLLSVGTLTPRKGYLDLVPALSQLADLPWQLDILGDDEIHAEHAQDVRISIADAGLDGRISIHGKRSSEALRAFYRTADIFVLAAHYEGYGMAFAEAVAAGLPVIGTTGGAIPRTVPEGCGLLVGPGDVQALRGALRTMITDSGQRARMAEASRAAASKFQDWPARALAFAAAVEKFAGRWRGED